jgi:hypothetical protein
MRLEFMSVCRQLPEDVQLCLVTPYAKAHHEICDAKMGALNAKN